MSHDSNAYILCPAKKTNFLIFMFFYTAKIIVKKIFIFYIYILYLYFIFPPFQRSCQKEDIIRYKIIGVTFGILPPSYAYVLEDIVPRSSKGIGKVFPLQARCGPEGG